jgi:hypothetical protein
LATFFGLFGFVDASSGGDDVCRDIRFVSQGSYDDLANPNEDIFKIAKVAGVLAPLMGGIATLLFFLAFFRRTLRELWSAATHVCLTLATLGQLGTFSLFGMSYCKGTFGDSSAILCSTSEGASRSIAAVVLYVAATVTCCVIPIPPIPLVSFTYDELSGDKEGISLGRTAQPAKDEVCLDETETTREFCRADGRRGIGLIASFGLNSDVNHTERSEIGQAVSWHTSSV